MLVHGLGGTSNTWTPVMGALARHRAIRPDLPGSGRSARVEGALSIERYVDCVKAVCDRLDVRRAHFVGHSLGTIVCLHLAARFPALVRSLALFGPLLAPPEAARAQHRRARRQGAQRGRGRHAGDRRGDRAGRDLGRHARAPGRSPWRWCASR